MPLFSKLFITKRFLESPLEVLFTLLIFILNKNLEVLPLQLTLVATIKPVSSLFSFYISSIIFDNPHRMRTYLFMNILVGTLPCLLFPFTDNVWFYIASYALFLITHRAASPAWMEVLKNNTDSLTIAKTVSYANSIFYFMSIVLAPAICLLMDEVPQIWRYIFLSLGLLKMINMTLLLVIKPEMKIQIKKPFIEPLKRGWLLLKEKPSFSHYLFLYCIGGMGIIGTQSILPIYFKDNLNLSYVELGLAFSCFKGLSFLLASPSWVKYTQNHSLYRLNSVANLFTVLYFVLILLAGFNTNLLYLAYTSYGIMLAGCELSKEVSGPQFSGTKDSTIYSSLNLALGGIRGCIFPVLGSLIYSYTGPTVVFTIAATLCLIGSAYGLWLDKRYPSTRCVKTNRRIYA
jgi:predicted MFS family arabinose efflux permease